jgi:acetyl esterase/lipase
VRRRKLLGAFGCGVLLLVAIGAPAAEKGRAEADPGTPFDLQGFIDGELKAGKKRIVVPPGRHRVAVTEFEHSEFAADDEPQLHVAGALGANARIHLLLAGLDGVEIVADGAEMICTEPTAAITFVNCRNVTLSGLTIDYDPLPFTQGQITGLSADKLVHEIELFPDYPAAAAGKGWKYEIFAPDTGLLRFGSYYDFTIDRLGDRALRLTKTGPAKSEPGTERVGDIVALAWVDWTSGILPHAVFLNACTGMRLENVTLHAAASFGFFEFGCDGSTYRHCRVDRRPATSDPRRRAVPRMRSLNADAFHSKHAAKGPTYRDCVARFMGDDCVAINGDYYLVTECTDGKARVLAKHVMRIKKGGTVEVTTVAGRHATAPKVLDVAPAGTITAAEKEYLQSQPLDGRMKNNQSGVLTSAYEVTLEEPLNLPRGSVIAPTDAVGNGFLVEGCDFGFNRSRGAIIKAGQGRIIGNRFTENWMEAIKLSPEFWWLEAGCGDDVIIEGNIITRCHDTAIRVSAYLASDRPLPAGAHNRITIKGNAIKDCPTPQIHVTSTDGLTVSGNTVAGGGEPATSGKAILLDSCLRWDVQKDFGIPVPEGVVWETGIEYANPDDEHLQLNLARPARGPGPFPAVLCIHGGGLCRGRRESCDKLCMNLAEKGYVAATISYRLAPRYQFPAAVHDAKAAVRWLRANAEQYAIDPDRIGATGGSAGGYLAQFLGVTPHVPRFEGDGGNAEQSTAVACVVNVYGPSDFVSDWDTSVDGKEVLPKILGGGLETHRELYVEASPLTWVKPDAAPTLCIHGTADKYVAHEQSVWLVEKLRAAGVEAQLLTLEGAGHGFKGADAEKADAALLEFFDTHLR